jgi:hypothetical protein
MITNHTNGKHESEMAVKVATVLNEMHALGTMTDFNAIDFMRKLAVLCPVFKDMTHQEMAYLTNGLMGAYDTGVRISR